MRTAVTVGYISMAARAGGMVREGVAAVMRRSRVEESSVVTVILSPRAIGLATCMLTTRMELAGGNRAFHMTSHLHAGRKSLMESFERKLRKKNNVKEEQEETANNDDNVAWNTATSLEDELFNQQTDHSQAEEETLKTSESHEYSYEETFDESSPGEDDTDRRLSELAVSVVGRDVNQLGYLDAASVSGFKESSTNRKKQKRARMVGAAVRKSLVDALYQGRLFKRHPEFEHLQEFLVIEEVEMTADLGNARVYWSCRLDVQKEHIENIEKSLRKCKGAFRAVIAKEVNIKKCPDVTFKPSPLLLAGLDTTPELREMLRQNGFEDAGQGVFVSSSTIDPLLATQLGIPLAESKEEVEDIKLQLQDENSNSETLGGRSKTDRYNSADMKVKRLLTKIYMSSMKKDDSA